jgi:hypothetical protein
MRYKIESTGSGAFWTITRLADGATLFLQGDDAANFAREIDSLPDWMTSDDQCDAYADAFVPPVAG